MPVAPSLFLPSALPNCAVTLADYARIVAYDEPAFFGVTYDGQELFECHSLWTEQNRIVVARALDEAQAMIESVTGFPLCPTWIEEDRPFAYNPILTQWGHLIEMGVRSESVVSASEAVSFVTEPAIIGPFATTVTDPTELIVRLPGTTREITPTSIVIASGLATIYIPRSRLAIPIADSYIGWVGYRFTDLANFYASVDIVRVYTDSTVTATLLDRGANCAVDTVEACARIENKEIGIVYLSNGVGGCNLLSWCNGGSFGIRLRYKAGLITLDSMLENTIVRLAHTLIPEAVCKQCDVIHQLWQRDMEVPVVLTRERINCPFGQSSGAWFAYKRAQGMRNLRMGVI